MKFLDLWRQSFHPGCQSCILLVQMNSLWDVGIRSDITWRETLFEPWRKNFGLFVKTALYVSKGTLWVKKQLLKVLIFFQTLQVFEWTFTVLGKKIFGRDFEIENCSLRLKRSLKKPNFWKFFFFHFLQNFERTFTVLGEKLFGRDIEIKNCSLRLIRSIKKSNFLKIFSFQNLQNFERTFFVLGEKVFGRDIKIEKCSFRLIRFIKKSNFWNFSFFSNSWEIRTNNYRARRKTFRQGYQKWKLQSSSQKINQKTKLLENLFFQILQNFERTFTVLDEKLFGRDVKIESCSLCFMRSNIKSNFWKISFFFKIFRSLNEHLPCLAKKFWAGLSKLKNVLYVFKVSFWV